MGQEVQLTNLLRERGDLPPDAAIAAAWNGRLVELRGVDDLPESPPSPAILGVTDTHGYLLPRHGVPAFDLARSRSPLS